ncbi:hypothetical protein HOT31_gp048 [Microbacterium phage Hendrix]|uniref:Uncharacterized protein n=1 Tax=Microbacterium phage Hendrix TaxID=2182341 RepID=A0A2U8UUC4_9CAUD|nr:hypothetical protein HOT31_gp048 [Microbacterium phage Hendrix]AWN07719.1 hypothetical protein PBI_HENDRIX_48 [Microbacterium phage Hendrix]
MTATIEEALEQGWLDTPSFFGNQTDEALIFFSKCHESPWVLMRRSEPEPVLNTEHRDVQTALAVYGSEGAIPPQILAVLPHFTPRPRAVIYSRFPEYRQGTAIPVP